jgi:hypothetical protein
VPIFQERQYYIVPTVLAHLCSNCAQTWGDLISMMTCSAAKDVLRLKWLACNDPFGLHRMEGRKGEFERLCSDIYRREIISPHQYMISGGYGSLFFKCVFVDGLAYSSIATDLNGVNVAIKGSVADEFVVPESFRVYRVTALTSQFDFRVQCLASAPAPDRTGEIRWTEITNCRGHQVDQKCIFERPGSKPTNSVHDALQS